jgi:voltage-gated potassium channel
MGMAGTTRLERRLDRAVARATTPRGAAVVIATVSTVMTVAAGILVTLVDEKNYPSIGSGLWWAAQTVTTVGYGDNVPTNLAGQLVAVVVMLLGIGFLTVITAAITSTFVERSRREQSPTDAEAAMVEQFRQLDDRLARIEAAVGRPSAP